MADLIPTLLFYLFSTVVVLSALMVISSRNPVYSVLFLILAFFNAAGLFVLLGAEYIAMTLVIVYVFGAVAVLFLFVVMMLDINFAELRAGFLRYLPLGAATAALVLAELLLVSYASLQAPMRTAAARHDLILTGDTNTHAIGNVMYTYYIYPFQLSGIILLIAMIGAIVLTLRSRPGVRRQSAARQMDRKREDSVAIVQVKPGEGAR